MKKIIVSWILISLGIGMIPVVMLGASQGGIALSPLIILFSIIIGLAGSAIHVNVVAYKNGIKEQKIKAFLFLGVSILVVGLLVYTEVRCELKQEYALKRASGHVHSKPELDIKNLSSAVFDHERCVCSFEYSSPDKQFTIFVSEYGKLHFSSH